MYDLVLVTQPIPGWSCRIFETNTHSQWGRKSSRYIAFFQKGTFGIVRAGQFQSGATTLAGHYSIRHYRTVYTTPNEINRLQDNFRSEEHTSELQSLMRNSYAVFCFKTQNLNNIIYNII